eukprot:SAG11_NODE_1051_length_6030_cov_24.259147_2_plen_230_part_00
MSAETNTQRRLFVISAGECLAMPAALLAAGWTAEQFVAALGEGIAPNADLMCFTGEYLTIPDDPNFSAAAGQGVRPHQANYDPSMGQTVRCDSAARSDGRHHGPFGLGATGVAWYRLPATKGLSTAPLGVDGCVSDGCDNGEYHCGTDAPGWLSGWLGEGDPDASYSIPSDGSLPPPVGQPPAGGTVCFDSGASDCDYHTRVRAVSCGGFDLWELPPAPGCSMGFCLTT